MTAQLSQIKWVCVLLTALAVTLLSFITVFVVVTAYASILAFQARGAPDMEMINAFANQYAPWIGPVSLIVFTVFGAIHVARRVDVPQINWIVLGALVSLINLLFGGLSLGVLLTTILTIFTGWFGSRSRRAQS